MRFVDEVTVTVESGAGGNGCVAWRREPHVPRGGPAGGDGGRGGDVVLVADSSLHTLLDLRYAKHLRAVRGTHGGGANKTGAAGEDRVVRVPVGTVVRDLESSEEVADLAVAGQRVVAAVGGAGGRGNVHFKTSTHQAPAEATAGRPGQTRQLALELRLLADVGVVGLPNAGKSTLIRRLSHARPRVADYPFTTLVPNLGVVETDDGADGFVLADIPGLVAGAHTGVGLGHRFLRHIERTAVLLYLLDEDPDAERSAVASLATLQDELRCYDEALAARPALVALNKVDLPHVRAVSGAAAQAAQDAELPFLPISAATGEGLVPLVRALAAAVRRARHRSTEDEAASP